MNIQLWDKVKEFTTLDGWAMDEIKQKFPFVGVAGTPVVLEYLGHSNIMVGAIDNLDILRDVYRIDPALSDEEALQAYIAVRTAPPPDPEPSAEERIAAALEFMNLEQFGFASFVEVERNFDRGLWSEAMVSEAVTKGAITPAEFADITGDA